MTLSRDGCGEQTGRARLYVVGGQQRHARSLREQGEDWYKFGRGVLLAVDTRSGAVERALTYVSPPEACPPDDAAILFKSATRLGELLYLCTQTEVLIYRIPEFTLERYLSLPAFNDVHHARPGPDGKLLVASSGLDLVLEIGSDGQVAREWNTLGQDPWQRFSRAIDYRRVASTKPHESHPNYLFLIGDEVWVTRFEQRDAISLADPSRRIDIGIERVHDGVVVGDHVYFTTVDAHVAVASTASLKVEQVYDLNAASGQDLDRHLGWCRGIYIEGGCAWVGYSRLRLTRVRSNVAWVRWGFKRFAPTRLACYDLEKSCCVQEINLQEHGLDAVFSILPADELEIYREDDQHAGRHHGMGRDDAPQRAGALPRQAE
jgi:hypothetical protein